MIAFIACCFALLLALAAVGWLGSNLVFHPMKRLPNDIWPEQFGIAYEKVQFKTADGLTLRGWLVPAAAPTGKTIMMCHGWGDNKGDLFSCTRFLQKDFNLFYFDFRHHGESDRHISSVGYLETIDINAALDFIQSAKPEWAKRLGIFGHSMGSSPSIWATAHHPEVKALAAESPINSFSGSVERFTKNAFMLPYYPFIWATLLAVRLRLGRDPEPYSPIYHIDKIAPRPLFIVTGSADRLMRVASVQALFEKAKEPKQLWIVPGADHRAHRCFEVAGEEYQKRLSGFFAANL